MSPKMISATNQKFNCESNQILKLSKSSNTAKNLKQSNTNIHNNNINKEYLLQSNCESKLSAFTNRFRNTNKDYNNSEIKINLDYNYNNYHNIESYSDSLQNSENGNMKILKSQMPYDLNDIYNNKFNLETFFNEIYYEKDLDSLFIIYIRDKVVNSIDYSKILIINNKNFFILQIPFDNGKSQLFRVDYGSEISMQNYTIEITEDILKIIITIESNFGEDKKALKIKKLHRLITLKLFFKHFKAKAINKIVMHSAVAYNSNKLKRNILNLLKLFYFIKIKENVSFLKIRKFVLRKNNFLGKVKIYKNNINDKKIFEKFMLVKMFFNLFRFKAKKLHETILGKNYRISMNTFHMKKFHENKLLDNVLALLKKEVNKKHLERSNAKMADYLSIFLRKKKIFRKIRMNLISTNKKLYSALDIYKKHIKLKLFKKLMYISHFKKRFYYLSNKYNHYNYLFLFFLIQKYICEFSHCNDKNKQKKNNKNNDYTNNNCENYKISKGIQSENNSPQKIAFEVEFNIINKNKNLTTNNTNNKMNESFSTINAMNKEGGDSFIRDIIQNNSNLISDLNKSEIDDLSKRTHNISIIPKPKCFYKNCQFKINVNFKNYIYANYYNNNFHLPIVKNIFEILKRNMKKSKAIRFKFTEALVARKLKLNKELTLIKVRMTMLRLREHIKTQTRMFWNKFKIKLNQKKLQKILKEKMHGKVFKFIMLNNFISFMTQINQRHRIKKYFECKKKFIAKKLLKLNFFQFLSMLYMKRKVERRYISTLPNDNINTNTYNLKSINNLINYNKNNNHNSCIDYNHIAEFKKQIPLLQSNSEKFEQHFVSRLISQSTYIKDLKSKFFYFKRGLNLRLNYYKLIINCKREKILKRKTHKFRDTCLKIFSQYYKKIKLLLLYKHLEAFKKQTQIKAFYSKIIENIKSKKRNYLIECNLISNSKKISFATLKEYYIFKKSKARKEHYFKKKLNALFYKYNYESFFLKNAETLKIKKYFANKLKKNQIRDFFKKQKKTVNKHKIKLIGKRYLIKKHLQNSLLLIKLKNQEEYALRLFSNRIKKYFLRYFLKNIKKLKIIKRLRSRKKAALKIFKKNSDKFLLNIIFAQKAKRNLTSKNKENFGKKIFFLKLKSVFFKKIQIKKALCKKFFKRIFIKKALNRMNSKKDNLVKYEMLKKKYDKKLMKTFLIAKTIIAKTLKMSATLYKTFQRLKQAYLFTFLRFLSQNEHVIFANQRIKKIQVKQFIRKMSNLTKVNSSEKKKLKKLKFKNYLKFFLNSILDKMLLRQKKLKIKATLGEYIQQKNFFILKKNIQQNKKAKKIFKGLKDKKAVDKTAFYSKFFVILKAKRKCKKIKKISLALFKRLLSNVFLKLQKNHFHCSQRKIANVLKKKNLNKNFLAFKKYLKSNSRRRFLKLKEETYKNKFGGVNNFKKFFEQIKKKISTNINCKESLRDKITQIIKFDSQINFSAYNTNFQKYLKFNSISNLYYFNTFLSKLKKHIEKKKICFYLKIKNAKKFALKKLKKITRKIRQDTQKLKILNSIYKKYLFKTLYKILSNIQHERIILSSFSLQLHNNINRDISNNNENSISASKHNNSILNYSDSFKIKIYNFLQKIRKSVKIKKNFEKFYQSKIIAEGKIFLQRLKREIDNFRFESHFKNYFNIQNRLINYKFFLVRLQNVILIKKEKEKSKKQKVFEILKQNAENEKLIKIYLKEASSIQY